MHSSSVTRALDRASRVLPALLAAGVGVIFGPGLVSSPLLQGDLPGHLETIRWYSLQVWPLPWGWDPRYLLGTPVGVLYPPLFHWLGGGLGKLASPEAAMKTLLLGSIVALPFALAAAGRGLGLRRLEAGWAAAAGLAVLWLPGQGLGGTLRQTLVAGNAANAFALPFCFLTLATLRRGLGRPSRWPLPGLFLALSLLSHFLVGAVAGMTVVAFASIGPRTTSRRRMARGALISGVGLLAAMPFLLPFAWHLRDGSPDAISYSPWPGPAEWASLAVLGILLSFSGRRARRILLPLGILLALLYLLRGLVFPIAGDLPFRMEWHRFRLFLYLALVPAAFLAMRRWARPPALRLGLSASSLALLLVLAVPNRYDAHGPEPVPLPPDLPDLSGRRVLVLASPESQNGSWHGLQMRLPSALHAYGTKGVFVEASPHAKRIFEIERIASGTGAKPRWWAIRADPAGNPAALGGPPAVAELKALGVSAIAANEPVAGWVGQLEPLGKGTYGSLHFYQVPDATAPQDAHLWRPDAPCWTGLALGIVGFAAIGLGWWRSWRG